MDYVYNIGKHEVTNAQYVEFLSAVAGVDANSLYSSDKRDGTHDCMIDRYAGSGTSPLRRVQGVPRFGRRIMRPLVRSDSLHAGILNSDLFREQRYMLPELAVLRLKP